MAFARNLLFDATKPVVAHCVSRCVRREYLIDLPERRRSLLDRMRFLTTYFAIDVLETSVLSNHMHVVVATHPDLAELWTDDEVAFRYRSLCPDHRWRTRNNIAKNLPAQPHEIAAALTKPKLVARWRSELGSLSFFHKLLKQKFAVDINLAEGAAGHCWEGRFKSIVSLDEPAIIAHMVYVALNPVRAAMTEALDAYAFSSVAERVDELKRRIARGEFAGEVKQARARLREVKLLPAMPCDPGPLVRGMVILPCAGTSGRPNPWFGGAVPAIIEGSSLAAFLHDIDAEGRIPVIGKPGTIPESTPPILAVLDAELAAYAEAELASSLVMRAARALMTYLDPAMTRTKGRTPWGNLSGGVCALARHARAMGRPWVVGIFGRPEDGGVRRVRAAPDDDDADELNERRTLGPA